MDLRKWYETEGYGTSVYDTIKYAHTQMMQYGNQPKKPRLNSTTPTAAESKEYQEKLTAYETDLAKYKKTKSEADKHNGDIINQIQEFIKEESGLNTIPEQYRSKVYSIAYDSKHSDGY